MSDSDSPTPPVFRIVHGLPTDEELAAVITVLSATPPPVVPQPDAAGSAGWSANWRRFRPPLHPGRGAWGSSGRFTLS